MTDEYQFRCDSTDEGHDISEGEMAYRIEQRGNRWALVEYLSDEPFNSEVLEWATTREGAEEYLREYLAIRSGPAPTAEEQPDGE